jgi:hypothetical protein
MALVLVLEGKGLLNSLISSEQYQIFSMKHCRERDSDLKTTDCQIKRNSNLTRP